MFYCEDCRIRTGWPTAFVMSYGRCEICGRTAECYDRPSSSLPDPIIKKTVEPIKREITKEEHNKAFHTFSKEILYHFNCCACSKWWSIGDFDEKKYKDLRCPYCGVLDLVKEKDVNYSKYANKNGFDDLSDLCEF